MNQIFNVVAFDTDSVFFNKIDGSNFSKEEQSFILNKLNSLFPENIRWEMNGFFPRLITLKTKNYIMLTEEGKIKIKGSSLKSSTLEPALKEMLREMIHSLVYDRQNELIPIYHKYIKEAMNIIDMTRFAKKITVSTATIKSDRANETRIIDALERSGEAVTEGDKHHLFFKDETTLELLKNFDGVYDRDIILEKLYKTTQRFDSILSKGMFLNYSLKRNKEKLLELIK